MSEKSKEYHCLGLSNLDTSVSFNTESAIDKERDLYQALNTSMWTDCTRAELRECYSLETGQLRTVPESKPIVPSKRPKAKVSLDLSRCSEQRPMAEDLIETLKINGATSFQSYLSGGRLSKFKLFILMSLTSS